MCAFINDSVHGFVKMINALQNSGLINRAWKHGGAG